MADAKLPWLDSKHPIWTVWNEFWLRQEQRLFGSEAVKGELDPFSSERESVKGGPARYARRQRQATYVNFCDVDATAFVGQLSKQAPQPGQGLDFAELGQVRPRNQLGGILTERAEMLWYNVDGVGNDGSQWTPWWDGVTKRAKATGHRWCFAEAPFVTPTSLLDEATGLRPFMVEWSPYQVTNWHYVNGQLVFAIVRVPMRNPKIVGDKLEGNEYDDGYYLLTAKGFDGFGSTYAGGGWWLFDSSQELIPQGQGDWTQTNGRIPLWAHFYEQTKGIPPDLPAFSRSGLAEIGNIAVSYMNQSSARDFDAWDAAKSLLFALGISEEGWDLLSKLWDAGSEILPVLGEKNVVTGQAAQVSMHDGSTGAVTAEVFNTLLIQKINEAREISNYEARVSPDASGLAQQSRYEEAKSPRLALMASNREQSENTALYFLSQRWGIPNPRASVTWPREFDLAPLEDDVDKMFATLKQAQVKSKTLTVDMIIAAAKRRGLLTDEVKEKAIIGEISAGFDAAEARAQQQADALTAFGAGAE